MPIIQIINPDLVLDSDNASNKIPNGNRGLLQPNEFAGAKQKDINKAASSTSNRQYN